MENKTTAINNHFNSMTYKFMCENCNSIGQVILKYNSLNNENNNGYENLG